LANHKSSIKRIRQTERRRLRNQQLRTRMRTMIKNYRAAIATGDADQASAEFKKAEREIRKAASKGIIPRGRADRSVSRLAKQLRSLGAAAS